MHNRLGSSLLICASLALAQEVTHPPGWVVISVPDYQSLRSKAYPAESEAEAAVEGTLSKVDYELKIEGPLASGRAILTADVLKDGWVRIPIPSGLLVRDARLDDARQCDPP